MTISTLVSVVGIGYLACATLIPRRASAQGPIQQPNPAIANPNLVVQLGEAEHTSAAAFSPDVQHKYLLTGDYGGNVILWDAQNGAQLRTVKADSKAISSVAFSPDGMDFVTGGGDGQASSPWRNPRNFVRATSERVVVERSYC